MKHCCKSALFAILMSMIATQASALYEYEEINGICYSISFADMTAEVSAFDAISGKYYSGNIVIPILS